MEIEMLRQIIAEAIKRIIADSMPVLHPNPINIGVSNRHIHLSTQDLDLLFGKGYSINCVKELSQPGQCAAAETVIIAGPKGCIENVRVLGPVRKQTQIEVSKSDAFRLGIEAPVRESGKLEGSERITVIGPKGSLQLNEGLIVAQRHLHMTPEDAKTYGVTDSQAVQVKVEGERGVIFSNVIVRVSNKFSLDFHIDIDEANCAGVKQGDKAYLMNFKTLSDVETLCESETPAKLVTEETVRIAWKKKATLIIEKGVICTPLARDTINELGMKVIWK